MTQHFGSLDTELWFKRVEMIANDAFDLESSLRHAAHLLQLTPRMFCPVVRLAIEEDRFEALLDAGEFDTAARYLVARPTALTLEPDRESVVLKASIGCAKLGRVVNGFGQSEATAILDAWTSCLLALRAEMALPPSEKAAGIGYDLGAEAVVTEHCNEPPPRYGGLRRAIG